MARSISPLSRIAGVALGAGGALTLALGAVIFFLLPFIAPFAVIEALVGVRVFAGRLGSAWLALPGGLIGLWLGVGMVNGFAGPVAVASIAVNATALVVTAVAALQRNNEEKPAQVRVVFRVTNQSDAALILRIEPWADEIPVDAGASHEALLTGPDPADFEVRVAAKDVTVYGWAGSMLDGSGYPPVPSMPPRVG